MSLSPVNLDGKPALGQRWRARWGTREIVLVARSQGGGWSYVTVVRERRRGERYRAAARRSRGGYQISDAGLRRRYHLVDEPANIIADRVAKLGGAQ
jgi:hypothetical protein